MAARAVGAVVAPQAYGRRCRPRKLDGAYLERAQNTVVSDVAEHGVLYICSSLPAVLSRRIE